MMHAVRAPSHLKLGVCLTKLGPRQAFLYLQGALFQPVSTSFAPTYLQCVVVEFLNGQPGIFKHTLFNMRDSQVVKVAEPSLPSSRGLWRLLSQGSGLCSRSTRPFLSRLTQSLRKRCRSEERLSSTRCGSILVGNISCGKRRMH